jgi:outer membrane receptor protein involved in Fe transport
MKKTVRNALLASTLLMGFATPALAQVAQGPETPPEQAAAEEGETITVTGSRIARPDLDAPSPVTTVTAEQFNLTGTVTVETLLNELPQLIPGNTAVSNNQGGESFSTLDLRGLGPQRTLILIDGERVPPSSVSGVVDIGTIPTGLIERVDVVTGGASAVYGSDAIAGVVNFVLKDRYEGAELTTQYSINEQGDGAKFNVQGLIGGNFNDDRGNLTLFGSYYTREAIGQGDRRLTTPPSVLIYNDAGTAAEEDDRIRVGNPLELISAGNNDYLYASGGSATPPWGQVSNNAANPFRNLATLLPGTFAAANTDCNTATPGVTVNAGNLSFNGNGQLTPYFGNGLCAYADRASGSSRYNFNPANLLQTPYERLMLTATGRYEITDNIRLKVLANYADTSQTVNLAPTPATGISIPFNSPLLPADLRTALASRPNPTAPFTYARRFSETGPRVGIYDSKTFVLRGTLSGKINDDWNWDATLSYGKVDALATSLGNINRTAVTQGLNGCPVGSLPGCVPVNIFGANTLTPAMLSFVRIDTKEARDFEQVRAAANVSGSLFKLPYGDVQVALGGEVRTDRGTVTVDDAQRTGNIYGFNAVQSQNGTINVKEGYGEIRIPLLAEIPFFHDLSVEAGARYSDYSTIGSLFNWKAGAQWAPISWMRFRGIYNRAARAPAIVELFQNGDQGFPSYVDPCNAVGRTAQALAICSAQTPAFAAAGGYTGFTQNNSQVEAFAFGNPNISEERAETYTLGTVLTPKVGFGTLSLTVDYYDIKIENLITTLGAGYFITQCYVQNVSSACDRIRRNTGTGQIDAINTATGNQGTLTTSGIDAGLNLVLPFDQFGLSGRLRLQEVFTWVRSFKSDGTEFSGRSSGGNGGARPAYKSTLTAAYDLDELTIQGRWNFVSRVTEDFGLPVNPVTPTLSYFDLQIRQGITDKFDLTFIVNNVLDAKAKRTPNGYFDQGGVDTTWYAPIIFGRSYTIAARARF